MSEEKKTGILEATYRTCKKMAADTRCEPLVRLMTKFSRWGESGAQRPADQESWCTMGDLARRQGAQFLGYLGVYAKREELFGQMGLPAPILSSEEHQALCQAHIALAGFVDKVLAEFPPKKRLSLYPSLDKTAGIVPTRESELGDFFEDLVGAFREHTCRKEMLKTDDFNQEEYFKIVQFLTAANDPESSAVPPEDLQRVLRKLRIKSTPTSSAALSGFVFNLSLRNCCQMLYRSFVHKKLIFFDESIVTSFAWPDSLGKLAMEVPTMPVNLEPGDFINFKLKSQHIPDVQLAQVYGMSMSMQSGLGFLTRLEARLLDEKLVNPPF